MANRRYISWIDYGGFERLTRVDPFGTADATFAALVAASNAAWTTQSEGGVISTGRGPASNNFYSSVGEMVACGLIDDITTSYRIFLPAPFSTLLTLDDNTVDILNPLFANFSLQASGELIVPQSGHGVLTASAGWLFRRSSNIRESYQAQGVNTGFYPAYTRRIVQWRDAAGHVTQILLCGHTTINNTMAALQAMSNAVVTEWTEGPLLANGAQAPTNALYVGVRDSANFIFADSDGNRTQVVLPAPALECFAQDRKTVDPYDPLSAAIISAALAELVVPSSGQPVNTFISGYLSRSKAIGDQ